MTVKYYRNRTVIGLLAIFSWFGDCEIMAAESPGPKRELGSEINLTPVDLDIPELTGLAEERFGIMRHGEPSG
jgi:hypothetical protein